MNIKTLTALFFVVIVIPMHVFSQDWKVIVKERLPEYGHRNWIIVADAAYPKQSSPGIETVVTTAEQVQVLEEVLAGIDGAAHIQAMVMFDEELNFVPEENAPGVGA